MLFEDDDRPNPKISNKIRKLGTTFHRSFWLSRPQIRQILNVASEEEPASSSKNCLTPELIRERTQLGTVQVEAMPRYARACGLLNERLCLTLFGKKVQERDPLLEMVSTQWLMHYFISAEHGYGPLFWSRIVGTRFRTGDELDQGAIADDVSRAHGELEGQELKITNAKATSTIFLKSYVETDALSSLGILEDLGNNRYLVLEPDPPSVWVFGLALLDYWAARYGLERQTINLDDLYVEGGLGDIFLMGGGRVNQYLRRLQEEGVVEVFRVAPPYQLVLTQRDPQPLLERLYAHDDHA